MKIKYLPLIGAIIPAVAAALVLRNGLDAWFIADDFVHLGHMKFLSGPADFWTTPFFGLSVFRPLAHTAMQLTGQWWGLSPRSLHGFDMVLHCLSSALVTVLAFRLFSSAKAYKDAETDGSRTAILPALSAGLVFAVHPVGSLTAAWFCCRTDLMAMPFSLLALIAASGKGVPRPGRQLLIMALVMAALLCKVTHLALFLMVFATAFTANGDEPIKRRGYMAFASALPAFNATLFYLMYRMVVLNGMGGYADAPPGLAGIYSVAAYHLPLVIEAAARGLTLHHMARDHELYVPIVAALGAIVLLGAPATLIRGKRFVLFGLVIAGLGLLPVWNLSHMISYRADRLLYLSSLGYAMLVGTAVYAPVRLEIKWGAAGAAATLSALLGLISVQAVGDWKGEAAQNLELAKALAGHVEKAGENGGVRRYYVLGLGPEHYYLDMMVKLVLDEKYYGREIVLGDHDSFLWLGKKYYHPEEKTDVPAEALPVKTSHPTDKELAYVTVTPPDLLIAAAWDDSSRTLEWKNGSIKDVTSRLKALEKRRKFARIRVSARPTMLPSYGFRKTPLGFDWLTSPELERIDPEKNGEPYTFVAADNDPYLISPDVFLKPLMVSALTLEMALPARTYLPPAESQGCLMWRTKGNPGFTRDKIVCFPVVPDGEVHEYRIDLSRNVHWSLSGTVTGIRLDPISYKSSFRLIRIDFES